MILKKPYAFLIKNFRLIHLALTVLIGYLLFRSFKLYSFFSRYVENVYATLSDAIPSNYITVFMFLTVIIIVAFSLAMYLLMRKKEKPKSLYMGLSIYYVFLLVGFVGYFVLFKSMETTELSIRNAMIFRDVTLIIALPQIFFLAMSLIRAVGFDIKKFNFSKDLKELDIAEEDNEEFEFILGTDSYKYFRYLRRKLREFKYYILENKFMFTIMSGLTAGIFVIMIIMNFTVYNRTYNAHQRINANNLIIQLNNSYLTNLDYKGDNVSKDKYYLVLNLTFTNSSGLSTVLDLANYRIATKKGYVYPTMTRSNYFVDLGAGYAKERFEKDVSSTFILVYELNKRQLKNKYTLEIVDKVEYNAGTINAKVKKVSVKPKTYYELENAGVFKPGKVAPFYDSVLGNSSILINSHKFMNKYTYKYEACIRYDCQNVTDVVTADASKSKTLLVLNGRLNLDKNSTFMKNRKTSMSFFDAFVSLQFDDKISLVTNATPSSMNDMFILQVDENAAKAEHLNLLIEIRNKRYTIKLK